MLYPMPSIQSIRPSLPAPVEMVQALGSQRQKITRACEPCRRRKAKCSGLAPCSFCLKHSIQCEFISTRHRRGPRPKTKSTPPGALSVEVAAEEPSANKGPAKTKAVNVTNVVPLPARFSPESSTSCSREDGQREWLEAVRRMMPDDNILDSGDPEESLRLRCHLIEVFFADVNNQQTSMLDADYFFHSLINNECSQSLINAICGASVPLSRHRALTSTTGSNLRQRFISTARSQMAHAISQNQHLDRLQTLCVLIACEFAAGDGGQAWYDIAAARSLLQLAALRSASSPEKGNVLKIAGTHLLISERLLCLGNPGLLPSIDLDSVEAFFPDDPWRLASQLLDLLIYVQRSSSTWATQHDPAPWVPNSEFINTINRADGYMMREFDGLRFDSESIGSKLERKKSAVPHIISLLAWHCCIILLNRVFLPIPQLTETRTQASEPKEKMALNFPNAPKAFLAERIRTCEASSAIICNISRIVVSSEKLFMPSFLGYCCFQSSVVMINQLRCTGGANSELIDNLKINFTILGAMGRFYKPSAAWSETLFKLHRADSILECGAAPLAEMFATYFSRFKRAKEPPYVGLDGPKEDALADAVRKPSPAMEGATIPQQQQQTVEVAAGEEWMREYEGCLAEQLDGLGDGQHQDATNKQVIVATAPLGSKASGEQVPWESSLHPQHPTQTSFGPASHTATVMVNLPPALAQYIQEVNEASSCPPESRGVYAVIPPGTAIPFKPGPEEVNNPQAQITFSASGGLVSDPYAALAFDEIDFAMYLQAGEQMSQLSEHVGGFEFSLDAMSWESLGLAPDVLSRMS